MEFIVTAVATVLAIRFALFITGYPQLGGSGLHIAHVLWGGLLMAVGVMGLLSFNGRVIRPVGSFLAGVGFGLFIDEVGKFLTSDNDYFFTPSIAIMYVVIVLLVLGIHALHGRRPMSSRELYSAALTTAAAGVTNGMTDHSRTMALRRLNAAGDLPGADAAAALIQQIPRGRAEKYDVSQIGTRVAQRIGRALRRRSAMITTIVVLLVQTVVTVGFALLIVSALLAREAGADVTLRFTEPVPTAVGGASSLISAACVVWGLVRLRQKRQVTGYRWLQRAVLIDLLLTRVFEFAVYQFAAIPALLIDLLLLAALEYAIRTAVRDEAAVDDGSAEAEEAGRWSPARSAATAGVGLAPAPAGAARLGYRPWPGAGTPAVAGASLDAGAGGVVPSGAADVGPGLYPGPIIAASAGPAAPLTEPAPLGGAAGVEGPAPLPAGPPALSGPAPAPMVLPGTPPAGAPGPYFADLPVASASGSAAGSASRPGSIPASGSSSESASTGALTRPIGSTGAGRAGSVRGASGGGAGVPGPAWDPARSCAPSFTGGCHSHAGVIGGAMAAGCGAIAGGLVAGVSTNGAEAHRDGVPADAGNDADALVGEALDDSRTGDHQDVPTIAAPGVAESEPPAVDEAGRSPRSVGGQPPAAKWIGSRAGNAGASRYAAGPTESNVDERKLTPPPLS